MKNVKSMILAACAVVILGAVVHTLIPRRQTAPEATSRSTTIERTTRPSRPGSTVRSIEPRVATSPIQQQPLPENNHASSAGSSRPEAQAQKSEPKAAQAGTTQKAAGAKQGTLPVQEALQDPGARFALAFVGADPAAEMYWYGAINDPRLPAHERQDLIEDLNEDGLSDPQNPTIEDLPLILSRIQLIETVVWDAMDEVNADAFQEAYKDLVNLAVRAMGNG